MGRVGVGKGSGMGVRHGVAVVRGAAAVTSRPVPRRAGECGSMSRGEELEGMAAVRARQGRPAGQGRRGVTTRCEAAAGAAQEGEEGNKDSMVQTAVLGVLFAGWYACNIQFNLWNKVVLKTVPLPLTCTLVQFGVGSLFALLMYVTGLKKAPKVGKEVLLGVLPLAAVHTLGNVFTNLSLSAVAVSFTHTIKAMEPLFSVLLSAIFLGVPPTLLTVLSLLPIVGGVALASFTEASFSMWGFMTAMLSNLTFQSRNVLSKKLMISKGGMDNIDLFSVITAMSFVLLLPFALYADRGFNLTPAALAARGVGQETINNVLTKAFAAGLMFHGYQQLSYMILQRVSPVTHSVGNCVKRIVVIVSSVLFFRNPVSPLNGLGTAIALAGVFAYSQVKVIEGKRKAA